MELNVLGHIYSRFYVNLLKRAEDDLFLLQIRDNTQPSSLFVDGEPEYTMSQAVGLYSGIRRCPQPIETHKDPPKLLEHTRSCPASPKLLEYTQSFSTEASRVYSVILQRQSLNYIRHALNMYFRFLFFFSSNLRYSLMKNRQL
jgi:hypothetical protein